MEFLVFQTADSGRKLHLLHTADFPAQCTPHGPRPGRVVQESPRRISWLVREERDEGVPTAVYLLAQSECGGNKMVKILFASSEPWMRVWVARAPCYDLTTNTERCNGSNNYINLFSIWNTVSWRRRPANALRAWLISQPTISGVLMPCHI